MIDTSDDRLYHGNYTEYFSHEFVALNASTRLNMKTWNYRVYVK